MLAAAEVLCLLSAFKPQCQQLLEGHRSNFGSDTGFLYRLKTAPARLNVLSCFARMFEVLLRNPTSPGLVLMKDRFKWKDKLLTRPLLDCIRKAVLEVRSAVVTPFSVVVIAGRA